MEVANGSFVRHWSHADVFFDCNRNNSARFVFKADDDAAPTAHITLSISPTPIVFRASVRQPSNVGLGETVTVDIDASGFKPTPNGTVVWPFVNRSQFGAFVTCAVSGRQSNCSLILPLPRAGVARVELAVFAEGRGWGGREGAWAAGMQGACDQAAGCVYPVGQAGPGAAALSTTLPIIVHVAYRRIARPGGADGNEVCMDFEPWFTKLNVPRWEGRAGASGLPLVGYYSSFHPGVMRQHAIWMTEAGITCVNVDWSNMLWSKIDWSARGPNVHELCNATDLLLQEYSAMRAEGHDTPKVMIMIGLTNMLPSALHDLASWIRQNYHQRFGLENFVQLDGRPVLPVLYLGNFKPFSVPWPTPEVTQEISANGSFAVRYMGVSLDRNESLGLVSGFWSWMDSTLSPIPAMRDGVVEALTVAPAFFKSGETGGWLGAGAVPQRQGQTLAAEMQRALQLRPKVLLVMQWNEWAGARDGSKNAFTDDYNLSLSNEIEPVSLTECGGYVHHDDAGQLPVCDTGYGFRNLNILKSALRNWSVSVSITRLEAAMLRRWMPRTAETTWWSWLVSE